MLYTEKINYYTMQANTNRRKNIFKQLEKYLISNSLINIALYGVGRHTEELLSIINKNEKFNIIGLIDKDRSCIEKHGYNLYLLEEITKKHLDCVIISSESYQDIIYERIKWIEDKGIKVIRLYKNFFENDENRKDFNIRNDKLDELPYAINIETSMGCNLSCSMCPVPNSLNVMGRIPCFMKKELFDLIIKETSNTRKLFWLNIMGEPLLNKNIVYFVNSAKRNGHKVAFTTNATLLNYELSKELVDAGLDKIIFSVDGFSKETYESIRVNSNYENVLKNINNFIEYNSEKKKKYGPYAGTETEIHCIVSDRTINEIDDYYSYWKDKVTHISFLPLSDWAGQLDLKEQFGENQTTRKNKKRYPCDLLWNGMYISAEGNIMTCCHDFKLLSRLSNIKDKNIRDIWNDELQKIRKSQINGIYNGICEKCDGWMTRPEFY